MNRPLRFAPLLLLWTAVFAPRASGDDTATVQSSFSRGVAPAAGTYQIGTTLNIPAGSKIDGKGAVILHWAGGASFAATIAGANSTIAGLVFDGSGICIADGGSGETINQCRFQNSRVNTWPADSGVFYNGLTNSSVNHCAFVNWSGQSCIFGYNPVNSHFDDNSFQDVWHGMHLNWGSPQPSNTTILRNTFSGVRRFALELQGEVHGLEVAFNHAAKFNPADHATLAYSLPLAAEYPDGHLAWSTGIHIHHNYAGADGLVPGPVPPSGDQSWGFEVGGADTEFDHNVANGPFLAGAVDGKSTPAWSYHDNVFAGLQGAAVTTESKGVMPAAANVYGNQFFANAIAAPTPQQITSGAYWGVAAGGGATTLPAQTIQATTNADGTLTVSWTGPGPLYLRGSLPADRVAFPAASSPATLGNLNNGWTVWAGDGKSEAQIAVVNGALPASAPFAPTLVAPATQATTQPSFGPMDAMDAALANLSADLANARAAENALKAQTQPVK